MPVESAYNYIDDLNPSWPNDNPDQLAQQATQSRGIKSATKGSFPNLGQAAVTGTAADLNAYAPIGGIIMYTGALSSLASGWAFCDGANGTVDLRDSFILGAVAEGNIGNTGGSADAIIVSHNHNGTTGQDGSHFHTQRLSGAVSASTSGSRTAGSQSIGSSINASDVTTTSADHSHTIPTQGSSATNANLPPYYKLAYIQRIA